MAASIALGRGGKALVCRSRPWRGRRQARFVTRLHFCYQQFFCSRRTEACLWHIGSFRCVAEFDRYRGIADMAGLAGGPTRSRMTQSRHTLADRGAACHGKGLGKLDGGVRVSALASLGAAITALNKRSAPRPQRRSPERATPPEMREVFPSPQRT